MKIRLFILCIFFLFGCTKKNELKTPYRENNNIYFWYYPQTLETNSKIIKKLNKKVGRLPEESNSYNWTSYNYYLNDNMSNYMWYIDIDLDNDNKYDYRGVYFNKYRPHYTNLNGEEYYSIQSHNGYYINNIYWFKYEIIKWDILDTNNNKLMIISSISLDSQDYYPSTSMLEFNHNDGLGYANNYELSNIRKFINNDFYYTAFSNLEKELIEYTTINNKFNNDRFDSNDTFDKVFLLSQDEILEYYNDSNDRITGGSDYAKAQGLEFVYGNNSFYSLRSPYSSNPNYVLLVNLKGLIIHTEANSTFMGVRPVMWINM